MRVWIDRSLHTSSIVSDAFPDVGFTDGLAPGARMSVTTPDGPVTLVGLAAPHSNANPGTATAPANPGTPPTGTSVPVSAILGALPSVNWSLAVAPPTGAEYEVMSQIYGDHFRYVPHGQEGQQGSYQAMANAISMQWTLIWVRQQMASGVKFATKRELNAMEVINTSYQNLYGRDMTPSEVDEAFNRMDWTSSLDKTAADAGVAVPDLSEAKRRQIIDQASNQWNEWRTTPEARSHWMTEQEFIDNALGNAKSALLGQAIGDKSQAATQAETKLLATVSDMAGAYAREQDPQKRETQQHALITLLHRAAVSGQGREKLQAMLVKVGITTFEPPAAPALDKSQASAAATQLLADLKSKKLQAKPAALDSLPWDASERVFASVQQHTADPKAKSELTRLHGAVVSNTFEALADSSHRAAGYRATVRWEGPTMVPYTMTLLFDTNGRLLSDLEKWQDG